MSSKFFRTADSSSESDTDEEGQSDDEMRPQQMASLSWGESSDEDQKGSRVVKSAREKRKEEVELIMLAVKVGIEKESPKAVLDEFDKAMRLIGKGADYTGDSFIWLRLLRLLARVRSFANAMSSKDKKRKLKGNDAKALNTLANRLKRQAKTYDPELDTVDLDAASEVEVSEGEESEGDDGDDEDEGGNAEFVGDDTAAKKPRKIFKKTLVVEEEKPLDPAQLEALYFQKLLELRSNRGKRNLDLEATFTEFETLSLSATSPKMEIPLLETIILFLIDADRNSTHMSRDNWLKVYDRLSKFMSLVETNDIIVHEGIMVDSAFRPGKEEVEVPSYISGFYMTLDEEWTKGLQFTDPHTLEFRQRLRDEVLLMDICERIHDYYKRKDDRAICADVLSRAYDHFYYRRQKDFDVFRKFWKSYEGLSAYDRKYESLIKSEDVRSLLRTFRREIEAVIAETDIAYIKTILETTYHYAVSDVYTRAKELIAHHRVQDFFGARLSDAEIPLQVLYNRVIIQLGLSAFRSGKIQEAYTLLGDLAANPRLKELIAQRTSLGKMRHESPEIERILRTRLVPFHMQIHVEEVEMVHQICCLLLELPTIAKNPYSGRRNLVSRTFARVLQQSRRHVFVTPPEHIKDFVYAASVSLKVGDWKECLRYLFSMKIWEGMYRSEDVKDMLSQQVKEVALRVYLLEYVGSYVQLDVNVLSSMFELSRDRTNAILCRMMTDDELPGSYTEAGSSHVSCRSSDMEETNYLAAQLAEKVRTFLDMNERMSNPHHRADDDRRGGHEGRRQVRPRGKRM